MNTKERIKEAVSSSNTAHILCNKLLAMSDTTNDQCIAKNLLLNIRHYTLTYKENVDKIHIFHNKSGDTKVINPELKQSLTNEGYNIITLPLF